MHAYPVGLRFLHAMLCALIASCGGGGGTDDTEKAAASVTCSSFTYQDQAQEYMVRFGATQLDGDRDGLACESLPRRPAGDPGLGAVLTQPVNLPAKAIFFTSIGSLALLRFDGGHSIVGSWAHVGTEVAGATDYRVWQDDDTPFSLAYLPGSSTAPLAMEIGRTNGGLVGFGRHFPGWSGIGMDAVGIELSETPAGPVAVPDGDYLFVGGIYSGVIRAQSKGALSISASTIRICPEAAVPGPDCVNGLSLAIGNGGPIWHTADGLGSLGILPNHMLAFRHCRSMANCTSLIAIPTHEARRNFEWQPNSYGFINSSMRVLEPSMHPKVTASAIPGIMTELVTENPVIQNNVGDYIVGSRPVFVAR